MKSATKYLLVGLLLIIVGFSFYYMARFIAYVYNQVQLSFEPAVDRSDYPSFTTPLPADVVADLCLKLEITHDDERCRPGATVFGPEFFEDINIYFDELSDEDATFYVVQDKLGVYLVRCDEPNSEDGHYRCEYDLRGDGIYPIFIYFTRDDHYYRIIANTGGS